MKGLYHKDEEEEDVTAQPISMSNVEQDGRVNLNRAMLCGVHDVQHELNLEAFDTALEKFILESNVNEKFRDPR